MNQVEIEYLLIRINIGKFTIIWKWSFFLNCFTWLGTMVPGPNLREDVLKSFRAYGGCATWEIIVNPHNAFLANYSLELTVCLFGFYSIQNAYNFVENVITPNKKTPT